jgi:excisionase family DNA binding protein
MSRDSTASTAGGEGRAAEDDEPPAGWRDSLRSKALQNALRKRAAGVPTYTVPEAAALMSISQEFLYRLIQADGFPAVRMAIVGRAAGRYVIPAKAVEQLLDKATRSGACIDAAEFATRMPTGTAGGVA